MTKYYTPEIEEFHSGFDFEYLRHNEWIKSNLDGNPIEHPELDEFKDDLMKIAHAITRVKHLDREDIESLGWKHSEGYKSDVFSDADRYSNNLHGLTHLHDTRTVIIWEMMQHDQEGETYFRGKIKNLSELKVLMNQVGISSSK